MIPTASGAAPTRSAYLLWSSGYCMWQAVVIAHNFAS